MKKKTTTTGPDNSTNDNSPDTNELNKLGDKHAEELQKENPQSAENTIPAQTENQGDSSTQKRKRGRPPGSKNKTGGSISTTNNILPEPLVKTILNAPYNYMANKRGEHWRLTEEELTNMVPVHMSLANEYLPEHFKKHANLAAALALHGMIIWGRIEIETRLRKEIMEENPNQEVTTNEPNTNSIGQTRYGEIHRITPDINATQPGSDL